jgi:hypothetical protein
MPVKTGKVGEVVEGVNENQQTSNFLHHCVYFGKIDSTSDGIV